MTKRDVLLYILGCFVFFICGPFFMFVIALFFPISFLPQHFMVPVLGKVVLVVGLVFTIWANVALIKYGKGGAGVFGKVKLMTETKHLVTQGPYAICRNPMHFGLMLFYLGIAILLNNLCSLCIPLLTIVFAYGMAIFLDEPRLKQDFPDEYEIYQSKVPRFFPRFNLNK